MTFLNLFNIYIYIYKWIVGRGKQKKRKRKKERNEGGRHRGDEEEALSGVSPPIRP